MLKISLILILVFSFNFTLAEDKAPKGKEFKMPDFSKLTKSLKEQEENDKGVTTCTDEAGNQFVSGQKGFDTCLAKYQAQEGSTKPKEMISEDQSNQSNGPKVGVGKSFKIK